MKYGTLVVSAVFLTIPLHAQSERCDGNTPEMVACLTKSLKAVEAELNVEYRKALKIASDPYHRSNDVQNLRDAERKWIAYRDAICKAEYGLVGGGTAGPSVQISCSIRITKQRIADLQETLSGMRRQPVFPEGNIFLFIHRKYALGGIVVSHFISYARWRFISSNVSQVAS